jgi:hypothetical protein
MKHPTLWRLDVAGREGMGDHEKLVSGLRRHLAHAPLQTLLVQRGGQQRAYIALEGCARCADGRDTCVAGCYVRLFERMLRASIGSITLRHVAHGLQPQPIDTLLLAWPTPVAQELDHTLLQPYENARLVLHWQRRRAAHALVALLTVQANNSDAAATLAALGWQTRAISPVLLPLGRALAGDGGRAMGLAARPTALPPFLLTPPLLHQSKDGIR